MKLFNLIYFFSIVSHVFCGQISPDLHKNVENIFKCIVDIINLNINLNGWINILCVGNLPDVFYKEIQDLSFTYVVMDAHEDDYDVIDAVPYYPNFVVISCTNFDEFETILEKVVQSIYWYPLTNVILHYKDENNNINIAKSFFILWYYKVSNAIIVEMGSKMNSYLVFTFTPYVSGEYVLQDTYGCWTIKPLGFPLETVKNGSVCVDNCRNVSINSDYRAENLGTCIGIRKNEITYGDREVISKLNLFEDKAKNLHGFTLRSNAYEELPFLTIDENKNGTYNLGSRDGMIWNTLSELMNFTIDLSPSINVLKKPFNFDSSFQQIFAVSIRKADLYLIPLYQFDIILVEIDYVFPIKDSGVCFVSHRANFETFLFDMNLLKANLSFFLQFSVCFVGVWFVFYAFSVFEKGRCTLDQLGRDFLNAFRNVLLINLHKPPKGQSFRIFLATSIWSFFVLSFSSQATITALFTAIKRGKEVETFEDIIEKGYPIEGIASPDLVLPDTEERFRKINSKLAPTQSSFGCITKLKNESHRFCLADCAMSRFYERNLLNDKGEQYLHISQDRIHNYYLNIILPKHSYMRDVFSKHVMRFFEAGLIKKWEQYRYNNIKTDVSVKPLGMDDLIGLFNAYCFCLATIFVIFLVELVLGNINKVKIC